MNKRGKSIFWLLFVSSYTTGVLYETVFSRPTNEGFHYNIYPFWSYIAILNDKGVNLMQSNYLNIALFIPLGIILWFAFERKRWWWTLIYSCALSICIEFLQLIMKRGLCEFDDVFHNVLGCMVGYWVMWLVTRTVDRSRNNRITY